MLRPACVGGFSGYLFSSLRSERPGSRLAARTSDGRRIVLDLAGRYLGDMHSIADHVGRARLALGSTHDRTPMNELWLLPYDTYLLCLDHARPLPKL